MSLKRLIQSSEQVIIITCSEDLIRCSDNIITRSGDLISHSDYIISHSDYIISRGNELFNKISMSLPAFRRKGIFSKVFIIYRCGSYLGHVTWTIHIYFCFPFPWRLHINLALIGENGGWTDARGWI